MKTFNPLLILLLLLLPLSAESQKIKGMEGQVSGSGDSGGGNGEDWLFLIDFFFNFGFYPTYGLMFGFEDEVPAYEMDFNKYPYADGYSGLYLPHLDYGYMGRFQAVGHLQTNEDAVYGGYLQVKYMPNRFVMVDVNQLRLFEALENETDRLTFTNINLQFNRVRHPNFNLWWGAGMLFLEGEDFNIGAGMSGGFTWYFIKPVSLHAETQLSWPNGRFSRQHQARIQVHLNRFMIYAGYQGAKIGDVGIPNWSMGTGVWF